MKRTSTSALRPICLAIAAAGACLLATPAFAQNSEIVVSPTRDLPALEVLREPGAPLGFERERLTLSSSIYFADLDLTTPAGTVQLAGRVEESATSLCRRLAEYAPEGSPEVRECVRTAVANSREMVQSAIAAAYRSKGLTPPAP